jgi:hypothetical protein
MAEEPDQIRDDIEVTRTQLAHDVDRLADKTSPSRVAQRRWGNAKARLRGMSDRVMGTASNGGASVKDKASDVAGTVKDKAGDVAGQVADQVRDAPAMVSRQTQGNPIAAGLIAFGAGMLVASLLPATEVEKRAGQQLREQTGGLADQVREPLQESAQHLREDLGDHAREAVASVKDTAKVAAQSTAQTAKDNAQSAKDSVQSNS